MQAFGTESFESTGRRIPAADARWRLWVQGPLWIVVNIAILALLTVPAWYFGGIQAKTQFWLFVLGTCAMLGCWGISLTRTVSRRPLPVALLPLALALILVALQTIHLSPSIHQWISPRTLRWWQALTPQVTVVSGAADGVSGAANRVADSPDSGGYPLSLYPASTRREGYLLALAVAAFTLGAIVLADRTALAIAGVAIAVNGSVLAFFGLAQQLTTYGGLFPPVGVGVPFASFVNRNNAAGFLNMCLACSIALSVWGIIHASRPRKRHSQTQPDSSRSGRVRAMLSAGLRGVSRLVADLLLVVARLNLATLAGLIAAACLAAGIFCSLSRGGAIGMVGGATVTLVAAALAGHWRRAWVGPILAAGLAAWLLVGYVGKGDSVKQRLATLLDESARQGEGRLVNWSDAWLAAQDLQPVGSGLGTYRYVYRLYQQQVNSAWFYHAENQYLQTFVEAGWLGLTLLLAALALVALACWRLLLDAPDAETYALGVAGTFALSSQAISAVFDFGLYLPANMLLLAAICGAVCGRAARTEKKGAGAFCAQHPPGRSGKRLLTPFFPRAQHPPGRSDKRFLTPFFPPLAASCCVALTGLLLLATGEARRAASVEMAMGTAARLNLGQPQSLEALDRGLNRLANVPAAVGEDAEAQLKLAQLWIHRLRLGVADVIRADVAEGTAEAAIWSATDTVHLHGRMQQWTAQQQSAQLSAMRAIPPVVENLPSAIRHLQQARSICPLLPEPHLLLAQLTILADQDADNRADLQRVRLTAPGQPALLTRCGQLELQAGRIALAGQAWRASLALAPDQLPQILSIARPSIDLAAHISELVPDSPEWILDVADAQFGAKADRPIRQALLERATRLVSARSAEDPQSSWLRGRIAMMQDQPRLAIANFTQAVILRPNTIRWRYDLAVALQRLGRYSEAQEQARICVLTEPNNQQYETLLREVIRAQLAPTRRERSGITDTNHPE